MPSRTGLFWLWVAVAGLVPGAPARAQQESAEPETVWHCWYDADGSYRVKCFAPQRDVPSDPLFEELRRAGDFVGATRIVRQDPHTFAGTMMYIPIYSHPMRGMDFVARLARAVMCRAGTSCAVAFDPEVPTVPAGAIPR